MEKTFEVKTATAMRTLGKKVGRCCPPGTAVLLEGPLGAGKTEFAKGFASALGIEEHIISPTFTLVQEYPFKTGTMYHFDLYRISSAEEFELIGGMEILSNKGYIVLIEWPEIISGIADKSRTVYVKVGINEDKTRSVQITSPFDF